MKNRFRVKPGMTGGLVIPMTIGICLGKPLEKQIPGQARNDWWFCHSNDNWNLFIQTAGDKQIPACAGMTG